MNQKEFIPSVNFHLWEPCNMRCKFCFASFQDVKQTILPTGHLPKEEAILIIKKLAEFGFQKITFAGGEPTLCPWLSELIKTAKRSGMTTMIVSNGSRINNEFLKKNKNYLDWIAISIDSLNTSTNLSMGRAINGNKPLTKDYYLSLSDKIREYGYGLKINTVVNRKNYEEDISDFIQIAKPDRWKILQVLPIKGQNDLCFDDFEISESEFYIFVNNHKDLSIFTKVIAESNIQMKASYSMIDPAGRFFDNNEEQYIYSSPILKIGVANALDEMKYDIHKFIERGGFYESN